MELFEIKTALGTVKEFTDYRTAKKYFDELEAPAKMYVIREPEGEADIIDSKPRVIWRDKYIAPSARFITIGIMALASCGCGGVTIREQNGLYLFFFLIFVSFVVGYLTAKKNYKGIITEKQMELMQVALNDGKTLKDEIEKLKAQNTVLRKSSNLWIRICSAAGRG